MYTLFIARGYPTTKYKTNGIFEFDQARALAQEGHKVVYAAIDLRSLRRWRRWGIHHEYIDGVDVYAVNIPLGGVPRGLLNKFTDIGLSILYRKIIADHGKPDILHGHFTYFGYSGLKLKEKTEIPLVVTEHSSQIHRDNIEPNLFNIAKKTYTGADAVISVSSSLKKIIKEKFNVDSTYIPNMVDLGIFNYEEKIEDNSFNFVSVGNLIDLKRMDLTIKAFYKAFKNKPDITLTIFGQGPNYKSLEELISKYNLDSRVTLMGLRSREEIKNKLLRSDCFVLPSQSETFGVAYIEALAVGVPVIATKCGGPEGFVHKDNGLMIDIDSEEQLIRAMKYMFNYIEEYDRENIAYEISNLYSPERIAKQLLKEYQKVIYLSSNTSE